MSTYRNRTRRSSGRRVACFGCTLALLLGACASQLTFPSRNGGAHPVALSGTWRQPEGQGPFPTLVLMHGCSGSMDHLHRWAGLLADAGYATLVVDSFGPRGVRNVCAGPSRVDSATRAEDAYGALAYLRSRPEVDPSRVGLIGWSHGGQSVLVAVRSGGPGPSRGQGEGFRMAVAFYPNCRADRTFQYDLPLLVLNGSDDDWSPAGRCKEFGRRRNVEVRIYPDVLHSFDQERPARSFRGKRSGWNAAATARAERDVQQFLAQHLR